ncbi:MAG: hypothetical protein CMM74_15020 [Rhodospirillaceae bacterium]|jgi:pyruvate,water dikinase|nr:hypothetical protein [Rhodospirillaceae bacterium]
MVRVLVTDYREQEQNAAMLGGKALHLFRLKQWGLQVPPFVVLSAQAFFQWRSNNQALPESIKEELEKHIAKWDAQYFAVRSSMAAEDGAEASYAGMMDTFLFVPASQIIEAVNNCFGSADSKRAQIYHEKHSQAREHESAAVVIQEMIPSEVSGVAFSRAPVGDSSLCYVESAFGLGEGVVSGTVEVDRFYADRWENLVASYIAQKETMVTHNRDAIRSPHTHQVEVPMNMAAKATLDPQMALEVVRATLTIERNMRCPADVEWATHQGALYLLQARPITTELPALEYFIDTNLSESYPGLISPMGASFVRRVYETVHRRVGAVLGLSAKRQKINEGAYQTLIANVGGHLYYNLQSYYRMLLSVPGGKATVDNWHRMIGGARNLDVIIDNVDEHSKGELLSYYAAIINLTLRHKTIFRKFARQKNRQLVEFLEYFRGEKDPKEIPKALDRAIEEASDFALTSLNDLLIMLSTRKIVDLLGRHGYPETVLPELIVTQEGIESLKPLAGLESLCESIVDPKRFLDTFRAAIDEADSTSEQPYSGIYTALVQAGFENEKHCVERYLEVYGHRCFEELKLESLAFSQSPLEFFRLLSWKLKVPKATALSDRSEEKPSAPVQLTGFSGWWLKILTRFAQRTIATREETRFIRGAYFGLVRTALLAMLRRLKRDYPGCFCEVDVQDFFGLTLEQLLEFADGKTSAQELAKQAKDNSQWAAGSKVFPEFFCRILGANGKDAWFLRTDVAGQQSYEIENGVLGTGLGASAGRVEGIPLAISDPREAFEVDDLSEYILVTKNTDPAWVFIMAQCAGLVSEKGSLLSHTAIIGRELGIPTVVGVKNAVSRLGSQEHIVLDGNTGIILAPEQEIKGENSTA